jgi:hypothetical protein
VPAAPAAICGLFAGTAFIPFIANGGGFLTTFLTLDEACKQVRAGA